MEHLLEVLKTNNMNLIIKSIREYLNSINMIEFEPLIVGLIKVHLIENDYNYSKVIKVIENLKCGTYKFDTNEFVIAFYEAINNEQLCVAKIYLDIIINLGMLNKSPEKLKELKSVLDFSKDEVESYRDSGDFDKDVEEYFKKQYNLLLSGRGIILLRNLRNNLRCKLESLIANCPDVDCFSIGVQEKRILVLRYVDLDNTHINIDEIRSKSKKAYIKKDYHECIDLCTMAITSVDNVADSGIYSRAGYAHLRNQNYLLAWDCLTVAKNLFYKRRKNQLIINTHPLKKLERKIKKGNSSVNYKEMYDSFNKNMDYYFSIDNIMALIEYIKESGLDVFSACINYGIPYDQVDIVRLIIAREFFFQGQYELGEKFIKAVERSPYKDFKVIKLLEILKLNKKFYCNREYENPLGLSRLLKP